MPTPSERLAALITERDALQARGWPLPWPLLNNLAAALARAGECAEALELLDRLAADPAARSEAVLGRILMNRGYTLGRLGRTDEAVADYNRAEALLGEREPDLKVQLLIERSVLLKSLGSYDNTLALLGLLEGKLYLDEDAGL